MYCIYLQASRDDYLAPDPPHSKHCPKSNPFVPRGFLRLAFSCTLFHLLDSSIEDSARRIQASALRKVGIPTGVGVTVNKTTAKLQLGQQAVEGQDRLRGSPARAGAVTEADGVADVGEAWGIGPRLKEHLNSMGIMTAWQLAKADPATIRRNCGVTVERTVRELNGHLCLGFGEVAGPRKMLTMSRSFGEVMRDLGKLETAIATFTARLAVKLRRENAAARDLRVFIQTKRSATMALWHRATDSIIFDSRPVIPVN